MIDLEKEMVNITIDGQQLSVPKDFTVLDAARSAKRLGATDVLIAYRRTKDEMPATPEEIAEAEAEGIKVMYLVAPKAIETADGKVSGIRMINQVLGDKDQSNRRRPEEYSGAEFVLPCDLIITAIGQKPVTQTINGLQTTKSGMILADPATGATSIEGVFAGGDVINVDSVISSIAAGKKGAASIDKMLAGDQAVLEYEPDVATVEKEKVLRRVGYFKDNGSVDLLTASGKERVTNFSTYVRTLTEAEALAESQRCLNCGCGEGCGICAQLCPEFAIRVVSPDVWEINPDECVACGMCYNRCPNKNIEMVDLNAIVS
jgi:NADH-quinone oxidoreductase subunit F